MYEPGPFDHVPANLGAALHERGFERLTVIQEAVLAEELEGRDMRISSQTGSGKTVAIGLALARDLAAADPQSGSGDEACPHLLLIAPTRELAAQLGDELRWLYRPLGKRLAVVTGGTNIGFDFRALRSKPDVLVGTPGRLLDHVKRGSVDLSQVRAVVLDEADEMLDMGFRDELEGILEETPEERHTHLVSATFPREVLSLASRYQREAVTVQGANPKGANEDITHVAHELRMGDRLDALINILLASPDERTLVFVRTRAGTAELATDLTAAGFKAFPLNGEMGQRERTSTLDAFRDNKVQLLIATDVAARGLDITGVTRVVHFDLPENPEAFTHRSGRTGRAGAKGTSILFVPPSGRRKVEYLARSAKIKLEVCEVPNVDEILDAAEGRLLASFENVEGKANDRMQALAASLLEGRDAIEVVAELLSRSQLTGPCEPRHIQAPRMPRERFQRDRFSRDGRDGGDREFSRKPRAPRQAGDYRPFQVTWGARQGADPRRVLALVCRRGNVRSNAIGAIRIGDHATTVEVRSEDASAFEQAVARPDPRDPRIKIRRWLSPEDRGVPSKEGGHRQHNDREQRAPRFDREQGAQRSEGEGSFRSAREPGGFRGKGFRHKGKPFKKRSFSRKPN